MDSKSKLAKMMKRLEASKAIKAELKALTDWLDAHQISHSGAIRCLPHLASLKAGLCQAEWYDITCHCDPVERQFVVDHLASLGWHSVGYDGHYRMGKKYSRLHNGLGLGSVSARVLFY